jgi:uncharacterized cupin superfamily protein
MKKHIINLDQLKPHLITQPPDTSPEKFQGSQMAEVAQHLCASKLGYSVTIVPPGKAAFPAHNHYANEEMFFILEGEGHIRIGSDQHPIRQGDFIACPTGGKEFAHQIINTSTTQTLKYIGVSTEIYPDLVQYPDSNKTGAVYHGENNTTVRIRNREDNNLGYWEGE